MRLKDLREERNLTQTDVANGIGTNQRGISRWENGENQPPADMIIALADFFEVSADYILGRSDDFGNVTVQNDRPALTAEEAELLECYRSIPAGEYRDTLMDTVRLFSGTAKKITSKRA